MMRTIEHDYDWQMAKAICQLLREECRNVSEFDAEGLADFVESHSHRLGEIIVANMFEWMDEGDWLEAVENN
jgi:uncharacterized protein (DUF2164 family)